MYKEVGERESMEERFGSRRQVVYILLGLFSVVMSPRSVPDIPRVPERYLTNTGVNFRYMPPI